MREAVAALAGALGLQEHDPCPGSHTVIRVEAIESAEAVEGLGRYLVGMIAGVVAVDLSVSQRYLGSGPEFGAELRAEIERVVGASNEILNGFRDTGAIHGSRSVSVISC
jgi:hypothetical protein